jgi:hypothetical protein
MKGRHAARELRRHHGPGCQPANAPASDCSRRSPPRPAAFVFPILRIALCVPEWVESSRASCGTTSRFNSELTGSARKGQQLIVPRSPDRPDLAGRMIAAWPSAMPAPSLHPAIGTRSCQSETACTVPYSSRSRIFPLLRSQVAAVMPALLRSRLRTLLVGVRGSASSTSI